MIGMRGARTSKIMLPFGRNGHLHTSASFKTIFENILTNHNNDIKIDPEMVEQTVKKPSNKWCDKNIAKHYPKYTKLSDFGSHFRAACLFVDLLKDFGSKIAPEFEDSRAATKPSKKTSKYLKTLYR